MYVVTHKMLNAALPDGYQKILVGPLAKRSTNTDYITDATGESISSRNASFCELTALYWIWKNLKDDHVGLCHYRRYFESRHICPSPSLAYSCKELDRLLQGYDMLVARRTYIGQQNGLTVRNGWNHRHYASDLKTLQEVVAELAPDYGDAFEKAMDAWYLFPTNMFYSTRIIMDAYCSWLFPILFECERRIDISNYDSYQRRVFGFMSERLMGVWITANKISFREVHVSQIDKPVKERMLSALARVKWNTKSIAKNHR